jgi:hypothetical protein
MGLSLAAALVTWNFGPLATSASLAARLAPALHALAAGAGVAFAVWLKRHKPTIHENLAESDPRADSAWARIARQGCDGAHCIVGAGPFPPRAARAFKLAGIPYGHFERHSGVGGIWDIENPGSSMYEAAHFISSKYTSAFFGLPVPDAYPDYRRLHADIRDFADAFGLTRGVTFNTAVNRAEPLGEVARNGSKAPLSTGETRAYQGLVRGPGVTWHPRGAHPSSI